MSCRTVAFGGLISLAACSGIHQPSTANPSADPGQGGSRPVEFVATLAEFTQRPTPPGLPTRFRITSVRIPEPGKQTEVTWRALDGDPQLLPRAGPGIFQLAEGQTINLTLRAENGGDQAALVLVGTIEGTQARGTFSDRLFYTRAGAFLAQIRQQ
jgi:hypothetical protein